VVTVVETPARETTLLDVVLGSFGVVGALFAIALVLGLLLSVARYTWGRRHPPEDGHMPRVA
jgi:hypothetical protein